MYIYGDSHIDFLSSGLSAYEINNTQGWFYKVIERYLELFLQDDMIISLNTNLVFGLDTVLVPFLLDRYPKSFSVNIYLPHDDYLRNIYGKAREVLFKTQEILVNKYSAKIHYSYLADDLEGINILQRKEFDKCAKKMARQNALKDSSFVLVVSNLSSSKINRLFFSELSKNVRPIVYLDYTTKSFQLLDCLDAENN